MACTYRGGVVDVEMGFLDTLAMVTLRVRQTEKTLLQKITGRRSVPHVRTNGLDSLLAVPKSKCDVLQAVGIGYTGDSVFAPAEGARPCMIV